MGLSLSMMSAAGAVVHVQCTRVISHESISASRSKGSGSQCLDRDRVVKVRFLWGAGCCVWRPGCLDPMAVMSSERVALLRASKSLTQGMEMASCWHVSMPLKEACQEADHGVGFGWLGTAAWHDLSSLSCYFNRIFSICGSKRVRNGVQGLHLTRRNDEPCWPRIRPTYSGMFGARFSSKLTPQEKAHSCLRASITS